MCPFDPLYLLPPLTCYDVILTDHSLERRVTDDTDVMGGIDAE